MVEEKGFIVDTRESATRGIWEGPDWTWRAGRGRGERGQEPQAEEEERNQEAKTAKRGQRKPVVKMAV